VLKDFHEYNGEKFLRTLNIYTTFVVNAKLGDDVEISDMEEGIFFYKLEYILPDKDLDVKYPKYQKKGGSEEYWSTLNDFAFLRFINERKHSEGCISFPSIPKNTESNEVMVIGYPGFCTFEKYKESYGIDSNLSEDKLKHLYISIAAKTNNFGCKILSLPDKAVLITTEENTLAAHRCPTLKGTSGAYFGPLKNSLLSKKSHSRFYGVHIGGSITQENNFAFLVTQKSFIHEYKRIVLNDKGFIEEYKEELNEYLEYISRIDVSTNPPIVHKSNGIS